MSRLEEHKARTGAGVFQARYLCGAARLPHHPRSSFPLRLRLLVPDWSLEPEHTNTLRQQLFMSTVWQLRSQKHTTGPVYINLFIYIIYNIAPVVLLCFVLAPFCVGSVGALGQSVPGLRGGLDSGGAVGLVLLLFLIVLFLWSLGEDERKKKKRTESFRCVKAFKET